jgi:murein DD-endopeptidase MepM/ murein hydrolase activator NlpD
LLKKFVTFVIIPQKTSSVLKFNVPVFRFTLIFLFLALFFALWLYMLVDYFSIRSRLDDFESTQNEYLEKKKQLEDFFQYMGTLEIHFDRLKALNFRLRESTGVDEKRVQLALETSDQQKKASQALKGSILDVIASDTNDVGKNSGQLEVRFNHLVKFFYGVGNPLTRIPKGWPVKGFITQEFGVQANSFSVQVRPNPGVSIAASGFSDIIAPADGLVMEIGEDDNFGNIILLDHGNGITTKYGHIDRTLVDEGTIVKRGDKIAQVGSTGRTRGPKLYYEVLLNGIPQDPTFYF